MARYSVTISEGTMQMGALGTANVSRLVRLDAPSYPEALAQAHAEHGKAVTSVVLMRQWTVKLTDKRDKRKRHELLTTAANAHDAVRNVGYHAYRPTGWSISHSSKQWPEAILAVTDTTPERDLGGAERHPTTTGTQLRQQQVHAIEAAEARRRKRRRR